MALNAISRTYHLSGPGEVSLTGYQDSNGYNDGSVTLAIHGVGFFPSLDDQDKSVRVALGSDVASLIASHLAEFAAGRVPAEDAHFTEEFGTTQLTPPSADPESESARLERNPHVVEKVREALDSIRSAGDVEVDLDEEDPDPELLEGWGTTSDRDGDYVEVEFAPNVDPTGDPDQTTYISATGGAAYLTAEDAQGLIDRLQAHIAAHSKREKRERSKDRNEWAAALFPGEGLYGALTWEDRGIVDRAIENHNALIGKDN